MSTLNVVIKETDELVWFRAFVNVGRWWKRPQNDGKAAFPEKKSISLTFPCQLSEGRKETRGAQSRRGEESTSRGGTSRGALRCRRPPRGWRRRGAAARPATATGRGAARGRAGAGLPPAAAAPSAPPGAGRGHFPQAARPAGGQNGGGGRGEGRGGGEGRRPGLAAAAVSRRLRLPSPRRPQQQQRSRGEGAAGGAPGRGLRRPPSLRIALGRGAALRRPPSSSRCRLSPVPLLPPPRGAFDLLRVRARGRCPPRRGFSPPAPALRRRRPPARSQPRARHRSRRRLQGLPAAEGAAGRSGRPPSLTAVALPGVCPPTGRASPGPVAAWLPFPSGDENSRGVIFVVVCWLF